MFKGLEGEWKLFIVVCGASVAFILGTFFVLQGLSFSNQVFTDIKQENNQTPPRTKLVAIDSPNWKVYRSGEFGFEIQAPSSIRVEPLDNEGFILFLQDQESVVGQIEIVARTLSGESLQETKKYLEDTRAAQIGNEVSNGNKWTKVKDVNLGNCAGVQIQHEDMYLLTGCLKENISVAAVLFANLESSGGYKVLYNQILSTFRFVE